MASLLSRQLHFPCVAPNDRRALMAVRTRRDTGPATRIVAFEQYLDAHDALEIARTRPLDLVIGPMLRYEIDMIETEVETVVWTASAMDVINCGVTQFHLDVCCLRGSGTAEVLTSYNIFIDKPDSEIARMNLHISWEM